MSTTAAAIEVEDLHVTYPGRRGEPVQAVQGVSFSVGEGEVVGLLGPNGAGKTSTLEVCEGFRAPTSGSVRVLGLDPTDTRAVPSLRRDVGVVLQDIAVEPFLTVREAVTRNAGYYPRPRGVADVLEAVGLAAKADAKVRTLSGGQQRRLDLALGIVGRPRLLFLDEPTTGFDPSARRGAWEVVRGLREEGTTVVLTTHYLEEAQALADRLCVLRAGRVVASGTPAELAAGAGGSVRVRVRAVVGLERAPLPAEDVVTVEAGTLSVVTLRPTLTLHALTGWAVERGVELEGLNVERASLEDAYLALVDVAPGESAEMTS